MSLKEAIVCGTQKNKGSAGKEVNANDHTLSAPGTKVTGQGAQVLRKRQNPSAKAAEK